MATKLYGDIEASLVGEFQTTSVLKDFFGSEPQHILVFYTEDKEAVSQKVSNLEKELGETLPLLNKFFRGKKSYNPVELIDFLEKNDCFIDTKLLLKNYFDYKLGKKIIACLNKKGKCRVEIRL